MDIKKFASFLLLVAVIGFVVSSILYSSGTYLSWSQKAFFSDELKLDNEMRNRRIDSGYNDSAAMRAGEEIRDTRLARQQKGEYGLYIFGLMGVLALGMKMSATPKISEEKQQES